jgi:hypothetical protein
MNAAKTSAPAVVSAGLRPLKWNERVCRGDYVEDGNQGFEPWAGPAGFRADSFVKQVYRRLKQQVARTGESPQAGHRPSP